MKKVLISDKLDESCVSLLKEKGFEVDYKAGINKDELISIIKDYHILLVRSATKVTEEIINAASNLEIIGRAGTGVDNVDIKAANRKGVIVMNTPGGNTTSAAEHTIALMLSMCRNIPQANRSLIEGRWDRKLYGGTEFNGKTLGVIGLGKIGREVAFMAKGLRMNVIGYDPVLSKEYADEFGIELFSLDELFSKSDIISVHVPFTSTTENLISKNEIAKCKDGVKIINCARGGIVSETDLLEALNSGKVSSAAFDVFLEEPPNNFELIKHPHFIATPHLGASTEEAQLKVAIQIVNQIGDYYSGAEVNGIVNSSFLAYANNPFIKPFVELSEKIGLIQSQLIDKSSNKISVQVTGKKIIKFADLFASGVLKGLFENISDEPVNIVNAKVIAEEKGIKVDVITSSENSHYANSITVVIEQDGAKKLVTGTVLDDSLRIVSIDGFNLEFKPEGNLLFYNNNDTPGILSKVSSVLAENKINIAGLTLGRTGLGEEAITIISCDQEIDNNTLEQVAELKFVSNVRVVRL